MAFDDFIIRNIDRQRRQVRSPENISISAAYARAEKMLQHPDYSIQMTDFSDLYGKENVMADIQRVQQTEAKFDSNTIPAMREAKRVSDVFEAIMLEQSELSNWLGDNVSMLKTAPFDDYFNGTDMTAEWRESGKESHVLALGVDVTFGTTSIERKLEGLRRRVDKGELSSIKYFKTEDGTFRGERNGIAHVLIGASQDTVRDLAKLWMDRNTKALAAHPIQSLLIEEMRTQLRTIESYARSRGRTQVAEAYRRSLAVVENVHAQKGPGSFDGLGHDKVFEELQDQTKRLFRS